MTGSSELYSGLELVHDDSIRLLTIVAGTSESALQCDLVVEQVSHVEGSFDALSYTWDGDIDSQLVSINGHEVAVRRNLFSFLYSLRSHRDDVVVWVDAICIDQNNGQERSHQVQMMQSIYTRASCTRIWLGQEPTGLKDLIAHIPTQNQHKDACVTCDTGKPVTTLLSLLHHRYWTRIWILQEVILAKYVYVHSDCRKMSWEVFVGMCKRLLRLAKTEGLQHLRTFTESTVVHINKQRQNRNGRGLPELLQDYPKQGCTETRDRVFGLLGLITNPNDPLYSGYKGNANSRSAKVSIVDYALPLTALFAKLMDLYRDQPVNTFGLPLWGAFKLESCVRIPKGLDLRIKLPLYDVPGGLHQPSVRFYSYDFA